MHKKYLRNGMEQALAHAIEECGEFIAPAGKTQRFGPYSVNPEIPAEQQETNQRWMRREMRELRGALLRLGKEMRDRDADHAEFLRKIEAPRAGYVQ